MQHSQASVTALLEAHREGEPEAFDQLVERAYDELRRIARAQLRRAGGRRGLQTTALVNELYLKLVDAGAVWKSRGHFFAACATAMRHILVDAARRRLRQKRGGGDRPLTLRESRSAADGDPALLVLLDELMTQLAAHDRRLVQVFDCRYFAGYSSEETAAALGLSLRTAQRDWQRARAWLQQALSERARDDAD